MKARLFLRSLFSAILTLCLPLARSSHAASWVTNGPLNSARYFHSATLLPNGKILVAGGLLTNSVATATTELYDPVTGTCTFTASMANARSRHSATMLPNGKVLIAGGEQGFTVLSTCELYDPNSGIWTNTGSLNVGRLDHTATLLANGKVLVAGGGTSAATAAAELYDYTTGQWTSLPSMTTARTLHCATLLTNGQVLVSGGQQGIIPVTVLSSAELYDPVSNAWHSTGSMISARVSHTATLLPAGFAGKVLVAGGTGSSAILSACELYNTSTGTWAATAAMNTARDGHTASVLPNGSVLVTGGQANGGASESTNTSEIFNIVGQTASWSTPAKMNAQRTDHTATLLTSGKVMVIGGLAPNVTPDASTETYYIGGGDFDAGPFTIHNWEYQTASLLPSGKVLVAAGLDDDLSNGGTIAELYDPSTGAWESTGAMNYVQLRATSTLLQNGDVLLNGNSGAGGPDAEVYHSALGTWSDVGVGDPFIGFTATMLLNGKVLLAGGYEEIYPNGYVTNACFLYDPATQAFSPTGSLVTGRTFHTATLLTNGQVIAAGGEDRLGNLLQSYEFYNPGTGAWTAGSGQMITARESHCAVLLPNGQVLVAGGDGQNNILASAEIFDPGTGNWHAVASMNTDRQFFTMTLLPGGMVLATSGETDQQGSTTTNGATITSELFDPASDTWTEGPLMTCARSSSSAVLLANGQVFVVGGFVGDTNGFNPELFTLVPIPAATRIPEITSSNSILYAGGSLTVNGTPFRDLTSGSGGNNAANSPTDYPLVQLRNIETTQTLMLNVSTWGTNTFVSMPVTNFPAGYALATVFVNGMQSSSEIIYVSATPGPVPFILTNLMHLANGSFQFSFTNTPGATFRTFSTTNLTAPFNTWTFLGNPTEVTSGHFQFTDTQAASYPKRFYQVVSP